MLAVIRGGSRASKPRGRRGARIFEGNALLANRQGVARIFEVGVHPGFRAVSARDTIIGKYELGGI